MIINVVANPFFDNKYTRVVDNTIHSVFSHCAVVPLSFAQQSANILYFCPRLIDDEQLIYKDDLTTATTDYFKINKR